MGFIWVFVTLAGPVVVIWRGGVFGFPGVVGYGDDRHWEPVRVLFGRWFHGVSYMSGSTMMVLPRATENVTAPLLLLEYHCGCRV